MGSDRTNEPLTPLVENAAQLHEMFVSFMAGGFAEDQALRLTAYIIAANARNQEDGNAE